MIEFEPKEGADYTTLEKRLHNACCDLCGERLECTESCGIQAEITAMLFEGLVEEETPGEPGQERGSQEEEIILPKKIGMENPSHQEKEGEPSINLEDGEVIIR